jgi:hypothetical protein
MSPARIDTHRFEVRPLSPALRKQTDVGAEVVLTDGRQLIDPDDISDKDRALLRNALYEHSVLVVRNQKGIDPNVLPKLAAVWDDQVKSTHSGGEKMVKDANSILSRNGGDRIPRAPQVSVLGSGTFRNYEGIDELKLRHVVSKTSSWRLQKAASS